RLIALTAYTAPEDRDRCIASGMDGVLTKPLTQNRLAAVLRGQSPEPDGDTILEAVGGNVKLLARVRDAFVSQSPRLIDAKRDALQLHVFVGAQLHRREVQDRAEAGLDERVVDLLRGLRSDGDDSDLHVLLSADAFQVRVRDHRDSRSRRASDFYWIDI